MANLILAINPGSTSTKVGLFSGKEEVFTTTIDHQVSELKKYDNVIDQFELRLSYIEELLKNRKIDYNQFGAVVGRGGLLRPIPGGTYVVNERMIEDLKKAERGEHASNLGALLARAIAEKANCPAFIVDPVVVDELHDPARISGLPELERKSIFHALNQKAVARKYAIQEGKKYENLNLIVAHLGGGISVGLHHEGRVVDVNDALSGEGPFSPNRTGGLPALDLVNLCYSQKYSLTEMKKKILKEGGLAGYLNTTDLREVEKMIDEGYNKAKYIFETMAYQVAKEIGGLAPVVNGNVDTIILTGGMAYSQRFTDIIRERVEYIAPVVIIPGEEELEALAAGAFRVINGEEKAKEY